jgi:hypothetical protein
MNEYSGQIQYGIMYPEVDKLLVCPLDNEYNSLPGKILNSHMSLFTMCYGYLTLSMLWMPDLYHVKTFTIDCGLV